MKNLNNLRLWLSNYDLSSILTIVLVILLILIVPVIGWYLNIYLKRESSKYFLSIEDYLQNLFLLFRCSFLLIIVVLGKFFFTKMIENNPNIKENYLTWFYNLEPYLIIKVVLVLLPLIIIYFFVKIWKKFRYNSYNFVCKVLLNLFFFLSSSLILYLILSNKCDYLLPYLFFNNIILFIKNIWIENFLIKGFGRSRPLYIFPEDIVVKEYLEGPPSIVPNSEFKERVKIKILSLLGYHYSSKGTDSFFAQFNENHWEFLGGFFGERQHLANKYAILRGNHTRPAEDLSLVRADKLIHFSLLDHINNKEKYIHIWTPIASTDFGLNLYKRSLTEPTVVFYKAYDTIHVPIQPKNVIRYKDWIGELREYSATYPQHSGKKLVIRVKFDDNTSQTFDIEGVAPNKSDFIFPLCHSNWLGMYFKNVDNPSASVIIEKLKDRKEFLDGRIHGVTNRTVRRS